MRCISCSSFSWNIICKSCQNNLLQANFKTRELSKDFYVYSFYEYEDIKALINTKYQFFGDRVFKTLAKLSVKRFALNFEFTNEVFVIPIDDNTRHDFSQSAILAKSLKSKYLKPIFGKLRAKNKVKYAGKSLEFRKANKRDFIYTGPKNTQVILVDDLVTSGQTILEAKKTLEQNNCEVLFAITLSDAFI
jgi:competence protein ComFC